MSEEKPQKQVEVKAEAKEATDPKVKMVKVRANFAEGHFGFNNTTLKRIYDGDEFMHPADQVSKVWMTVIE